MKNKVCICGGGSLGTVCAGFFLSRGFTVNLLTGHPTKWNKSITVTDLNENVFKGELSIISDSASETMPDADIVLLCVPGFLIKETLEKIKPYLSQKTLVGSVVGSTGFFFFAHEILPKETPLFSFQRVPFISRYNSYGHSATLLGYKKELKVAAENCRPDELKTLLEYLFDTKVALLDNYLEVSLSNSNPILHTGRLYALWGKEEFSPVSSIIKFYSEWTDESSDIVLGMDEEFMRLISVLGLPPAAIPSLKDYYEITDSKTFTKKIRSIAAFKNIDSPMVKTSEGWIPDFSSRYFTEDFPFGLKFIKDLAHEHNVVTPIIDQVYNWGMSKIKTLGKI